MTDGAQLPTEHCNLWFFENEGDGGTYRVGYAIGIQHHHLAWLEPDLVVGIFGILIQAYCCPGFLLQITCLTQRVEQDGWLMASAGES